MFAKAFTFASLASLASAHMIMANPKPYGNPSNAPLMENGSDFPCKGVVNDGSASNTYKQGSTQELSFTGQAVHGGGSCQISLTTDKNPTKNSVWKVIKSIEGGCPAKNTPGNLGDNANADNPYKYDFDIPEELAAGEYTLAWTWFNHVGNREMYMNCAAVNIEGSGGSEDYLQSLPDMFVANIGNGCGTVDSKDLKFFSPGKNVDRFGINEEAYATATGSCAKGSGSGGSPAPTGGSGSAPAPTTNNGGQPTQAPAVPSAAPSDGSNSGDGSNGAPQIPGGAFITVSQPAASQPSATQAPEVSAAPETPAVPETPDNGSDEGSGEGSGSDGGNKGGDAGSGSGGFAAGTACTSEGEWNCIGGTSFQRCASGAWTASQGLSSGVSCTPGQSADIGMTTTQGKRNMRRARRS